MIPREGIVAEYLFNGNADDSSGHGHHGTAFGATPTLNRFNKENSAYRFDGADDYVIIAPPPALSAEALSVSVWVRYDRQSFRNEWSNCIVCQDNGNDSDPSRRIFQLSTNRNHIVWHRMLDARDPMFKQRLLSSIWYHVVAVCERGEQRLYVDGLHRDSVKHPLSVHAEEPIYIGRKGTPEPYFFFCGAIDDVRIYNRALLPEDVLALYREDGFDKPVRPMFRASEDPISGKWGQRGVVFLDLSFDGTEAVNGSIMAGKPSNMAPVAKGTFDRATGALRLEGEATPPDNGAVVQYLIEGILDGHEVTVSAEFFGVYAGNHTLTKAGARRGWWKRSKVRRLLLQAAHRALRFVFGLSRPSKTTNSRLLR